MKSWVSSAFCEPSFSTSQPKKDTTLSTNKAKSFQTSKSINKNINFEKIFISNTTTNNKSNKNESNISLAIKYEPKQRSDLVVHKNKIDQLNSLLDDILSKKNGSILLIEGPAGCGKYSTLKILCKEKNVELLDWEQSVLNLKSIDIDTSAEEQNYESQIKIFNQYLFKSSRYHTDQIFKSNLFDSKSVNNNNKLLFVKEIPNFAFRDSKSFLNILNDFKKFSKFSIIFSITQTKYTSELNPHKIFTTESKRDLNIIEISFNSLANTYLSKHIERVAKLENFNFVDKKFLENICNISNGDLRHAINLLELSSTESKRAYKDISNIEAIKPVKRKAGSSLTKAQKVTTNSNCFESSSKDANFSIFRGLGKILHRKNLDEDKPFESNLPNHLLKFKRPSLNTDPEDIYDKLPLSSDLTLSYLHQNYLDIFNVKSSSANFNEQFDALISINESFIESDIINKKSCLFEMSSSGNQEARLKEISGVFSIRSILFNFYFEKENKSSSSRSLWMPLYKPYNSKMIESIQKRKKIARDFLNLAYQNDERMIKYLIEMNKEFFIEFIPFIQLKFCKKGNLSYLNRPEYAYLFTKYKQICSKTNQTHENDYENLNDEQNENISEYKNNDDIIKKEDNSEDKNNDNSVKGNYVYEDPSGLNIVDYNF